MKKEKEIELEPIARWVADRALEIVLEKLDDVDISLIEDEDIQHVGYSPAIMGYDK